TEIVIHVNMLKEGWDVTNLYTIVPLRAANARTLVEQSIGRGLRLPYGRRTGVPAVDRLNIIAHDRFQEIIDEANRPGSVIRLQTILLDPARQDKAPATVVGTSRVRIELGLGAAPSVTTVTPAESKAADLILRVIEERSKTEREKLPAARYLDTPEMKTSIVAEAQARYVPPAELGFDEPPNFEALATTVIDLLQKKTIDIPRIIILPKGKTTAGFSSFTLDCGPLTNLQPVSQEVLIQHLRTQERYSFSFAREGDKEERLENYIVRSLIDFDDISYDDNADLLYDLAAQVVRNYLVIHDEEQTQNILSYHQKRIGDYVHAQMLDHRFNTAIEYEAIVSRGFTELLDSAFSIESDKDILDIHTTIEDKGKMSSYLFRGFKRCLYEFQKFDSDTERRFAIICDRDSIKWMKPARRQFNIFYQLGHEQLEYVPDFVVELESGIWLAETKMRKELDSAEVIAKRDAAIEWCRYANEHAAAHDLKPWHYTLIPHDKVMDSMGLKTLLLQNEKVKTGSIL
ncbi:MAG: type III restriction endonuclease subunit R, partial [Spirochaetales bacterium]